MRGIKLLAGSRLGEICAIMDVFIYDYMTYRVKELLSEFGKDKRSVEAKLKGSGSVVVRWCSGDGWEFRVDGRVVNWHSFMIQCLKREFGVDIPSSNIVYSLLEKWIFRERKDVVEVVGIFKGIVDKFIGLFREALESERRKNELNTEVV